MRAVRPWSNLGDDAVARSGGQDDDQARRRGGIGGGHWQGSWRDASAGGLTFYRMMRLPDIFAVSGSEDSHWVVVSRAEQGQTFDRQEISALDSRALNIASDEVPDVDSKDLLSRRYPERSQGCI
jgi:hypothetical protein